MKGGAERRVVRGVQSEGRGVGGVARPKGHNYYESEGAAWQRGPRTSDVRYGPTAGRVVSNTNLRVVVVVIFITEQTLRKT